MPAIADIPFYKAIFRVRKPGITTVIPPRQRPGEDFQKRSPLPQKIKRYFGFGSPGSPMSSNHASARLATGRGFPEKITTIAKNKAIFQVRKLGITTAIPSSQRPVSDLAGICRKGHYWRKKVKRYFKSGSPRSPPSRAQGLICFRGRAHDKTVFIAT